MQRVKSGKEWTNELVEDMFKTLQRVMRQMKVVM